MDLTPGHRDSLVAQCSGHPYSLSLLSKIARTESLHYYSLRTSLTQLSLRDVDRANDTLASQLYGEAFISLVEEKKRFLLALSLFNGAVTTDVMYHVRAENRTNHSEAKRESNELISLRRWLDRRA